MFPAFISRYTWLEFKSAGPRSNSRRALSRLANKPSCRCGRDNTPWIFPVAFRPEYTCDRLFVQGSRYLRVNFVSLLSSLCVSRTEQTFELLQLFRESHAEKFWEFRLAWKNLYFIKLMAIFVSIPSRVSLLNVFPLAEGFCWNCIRKIQRNIL